MKMTRATVALAEYHIRRLPRGRRRLEWMRLLRTARQVLRRLTLDWIDGKTGDRACP